jgi:hypothetical protein
MIDEPKIGEKPPRSHPGRREDCEAHHRGDLSRRRPRRVGASGKVRGTIAARERASSRTASSTVSLFISWLAMHSSLRATFRV